MWLLAVWYEIVFYIGSFCLHPQVDECWGECHDDASSRIFRDVSIFLPYYTASRPMRHLRMKAFSLCLNLECADKLHVENEIWDPEPNCPNVLKTSSRNFGNNINSVYPQCCPVVAMNLTFVWQVCEILNPEITISGDYILNMKSLAQLQTGCEDEHEGESDQSEEVEREQCLAGKQHLDP